VLSSSSRFFQRALQQEWRSLRDEPYTISLAQHHSIDNVKLYVHWLYASSFPAPPVKRLAQAYVIGEELMDIKYKNVVLRHIFEALKPAEDGETLSNTTVNTLYEGTTPGSPARRLVADLCVYHAGTKGIRKHFLEGSKVDILVGIIMAMKPIHRGQKRKWGGQELRGLFRSREGLGRESPLCASCTSTDLCACLVLISLLNMS
jgi:hypothetical protein